MSLTRIGDIAGYQILGGTPMPTNCAVDQMPYTQADLDWAETHLNESATNYDVEAIDETEHNAWLWGFAPTDEELSAMMDFN